MEEEDSWGKGPIRAVVPYYDDDYSALLTTSPPKLLSGPAATASVVLGSSELLSHGFEI